MTILALDISSNTGYALLTEGGSLKAWGNLWNDKVVHEHGEYPWSYVDAAGSIAEKVEAVVNKYNPGRVIIEETNKAKARYTQKFLEFTHLSVLKMLRNQGYTGLVTYISTSIWRRQVGIELSKEQKKANAKLSKAKSKAGGSLTPAEKKALGVKGRVTKKHIAVQEVNRRFGLEFKQKDNDVAEAILLGCAYIEGAPHADGKK